MLFPIIRVIDNDSSNKTPHVVGTNSHDMLEIDKKTGGIQYLNLQCSEGTTVYDGKSTFSFKGIEDDYFGPRIEMVSFERLCEIYLEQTKQSAEQEAKLREFIKKIQAEHDQIIHDNGLDVDDGIRHTGGTLLG